MASVPLHNSPWTRSGWFIAVTNLRNFPTDPEESQQVTDSLLREIALNGKLTPEEIQ